MSQIDIIVPMYNEQESIASFWEVLYPVILHTDATFKVLFIDDGSQDGTLNKIKAIQNEIKKDKISVQYISFVRNYGKEAAMLAGLQNSKGDYVIFIDSDLQDPPNLIPKLYNEIQKDIHEVIFTRRTPKPTKVELSDKCANIFYDITNMPRGLRDYCIFTGSVRERLLSLSESQRFTRYLIHYVTSSDKKVIDFDYIERRKGVSKWSFTDLINYAWTGIICINQKMLLTIHNIAVVITGFFLLLAFMCNLGASIMIMALFGYLVFSATIILYFLDTVCANTKKRSPYFVKEMGGFDFEE